ncbi:ABC transporter B family member 29, chloroplastic [Apostasia shenzhenica]|uniref:ABC transporter B family member 29, chloroplastic n=1 Tax=Apostasia shenzhenica TaxID=1088818 RepID=A0A2I0B3L5_9ASPA|nr:ABC transporter B family member 29, chloroplastic [Apostasia shenzhenica]
MLLIRAPLPRPSISASKSLTLYSSNRSFHFPLSFPSSPYESFGRLSLGHRLRCPSLASSSLFQIKPYLQSEWECILKGWICSTLSVYCLALAVPKAGWLPSSLTSLEAERVVGRGMALAALAVARSAANYLQQAFLWEAAMGTAYRIRAYVFGRVLERDLAFFEGNEGVVVGDLAHRLTSEAMDVADTVYALLNTLVPNTLQFVVMASQMVLLSPRLALVSAMGIPCMLFVSGYLGQRLQAISRRSHLSAAKLSSYLSEVLSLMVVVKANNGALSENIRFQRLAQDDLLAHLRKKKMKAFIPQIVHFVYIGGLIVLCASARVFSQGIIDGSAFFSFIMSLALVVDPIQGMGKAFNELKEGEPAVERLFDLTQFYSKVDEKPNAGDLCCVSGDIKFCGVTFRYMDNMPPVLNRLDLHIKSGEKVAIIGRSGGGKSTLVKLLLRLYDPLCGQILLDDHDIKEVKLKSLREHIVLVPQDTMLFSGTVAENIGYKDATRGLDMKCIENAARIANADEFIRQLPHGYETNIGPRGSLLSGGQRQRITIARALYQKSSILILDEATSALDSSSELLVREALIRLMEYNSVLIIAHRPETMMMADRVLLLEEGKLKEVSKSSLFTTDGQSSSLIK